MEHVKWQVIILAENLKSNSDSDKIAVDFKNMLRDILSIKFPVEVNINICIHTDFGLEDLFDTNVTNGQLNITEGAGFRIFRVLSITEVYERYIDVPMFHLYELEKKLVLLENQTGIQMSSEQTISDAFHRCNSEVHFEKSIILTFDHANAFGFFKDRVIEKKVAKVSLTTLKPGRLKSVFKGETFYQKEGFKLLGQTDLQEQEVAPYFTMDEMASCIRQSFPAQKADVVIMLNCFMMSMDTLYALKDQVDFLVAPETAICFYGYHYKEIFTNLANRATTIQPQEICSIAVASIGDSPEYARHPKYLGKLALYGADLTVFRRGKITTTENNLFEYLIGLDELKKAAILKIRKGIWSLSFTASISLKIALIDTVGWFNYCNKIINDEGFSLELMALKDEILEMLGGTEWPRIYRGKEISLYDKMPVNGTSNYIPFKKEDLKFPCFVWFYQKDPSVYSKQSRLTHFLMSYYGLTLNQ